MLETAVAAAEQELKEKIARRDALGKNIDPSDADRDAFIAATVIIP